MGVRRAPGLIFLAGAVAALAMPAPATAAFPGANGRLAFGWFDRREDELGQNPTIVKRSIDAAGPGGQRRRSLRACTEVGGQPHTGDCSIEYRSPTWSSAGIAVAFDAGTRLAVMRRDGSQFSLLAQHTSDDGEPAFAIRTDRLVFSGIDAASGRTELYIRELSSGGVRRLTSGGGRSPAWSTTGRIAFTRGGFPGRPGTGTVYTVRPGGAHLRSLVRGASDPAWSPRGDRLVVVRRRGARTSLWIVRADGSGLRRMVTPGADNPQQPCWSPDGRQIAYTSFEGTLVVQRLRDRRIQQVAPGAFSAERSFAASSPDWQPLPRR
jgi:WD40 repeat protein